jgi:hypothetical protein
MKILSYRRFRVFKNPLIGLFMMLPILIYYMTIFTLNMFVVVWFLMTGIFLGIWKSIKYILKIEGDKKYEKKEAK